MTDQIEVQEKVRWEDLEVDEEPKYYFEGLGDAAAETHQFICEEISRRKKLKVAEEQEVTEWEEGKEPVPTELKHQSVANDLDERYEKALNSFDQMTDGAKALASVNAIMQGVLMVSGISAEEFAEAMEGRARADLEQEMDLNRFQRIVPSPELPLENGFRFVDRREWLEYVAQCTPSRNTLTGE